MIYKPSHQEINLSPSMLNTSLPTGVASQLTGVAKSEPSFDGITIDQMRGNVLYEGHRDDIDKVGLAQQKIVETAKTVKSKSKVIRAFNDHAQKVNIPKK